MGHAFRMGCAHIAEVPGFVGDAGDVFLPRRVALNKAIGRGQLPKALADTLIRKVGADEIYTCSPQAQVDGKAGLVLTVAGEGPRIAL